MKSFNPFVSSFKPGAALLAVWAATLLCARADDVIPNPFPADRYAKMAAHSPFAPPTAPAPPPTQAPPPPKSSFTDKLKVNGMVQSEGIYYVTVEDTDTQEHTLLTSKPTPPPGRPAPSMFISSVKWHPAPGKDEQAEITIKKDAEFGVLRYAPGANSGGMTGGPGLAGNSPRPPGGGIVPGVNRPYTPPTVPGSVPAVPNPAAAAALAVQRRAPIRGPQPPPAPGGRPVVPPGTATTLAPTVKPGALNADDDDDDD